MTNPISMSEDTASEIFSFISPKEYGNMARVCKLWNERLQCYVEHFISQLEADCQKKGIVIIGRLIAELREQKIKELSLLGRSIADFLTPKPPVTMIHQLFIQFNKQAPKEVPFYNHIKHVPHIDVGSLDSVQILTTVPSFKKRIEVEQDNTVENTQWVLKETLKILLLLVGNVPVDPCLCPYEHFVYWLKQYEAIKPEDQSCISINLETTPESLRKACNKVKETFSLRVPIVPFDSSMADVLRIVEKWDNCIKDQNLLIFWVFIMKRGREVPRIFEPNKIREWMSQNKNFLSSIRSFGFIDEKLGPFQLTRVPHEMKYLSGLEKDPPVSAFQQWIKKNY